MGVGVFIIALLCMNVCLCAEFIQPAGSEKHEDRLPPFGVLNGESVHCPVNLRSFRSSMREVSNIELPRFYIVESSMHTDWLERCFRDTQDGAFEFVRLKDSGTWHLMKTLHVHPRRVTQAKDADMILLDAMIELSFNVGDCNGTTALSRQRNFVRRLRSVLEGLKREVPITFMMPCVSTCCIKTRAFTEELRQLIDQSSIYIAYMPLYYMVGTHCTNKILSIPYPPNHQVAENRKKIVDSQMLQQSRSVFCAFQGVVDRDDGGVRSQLSKLAERSEFVIVPIDNAAPPPRRDRYSSFTELMFNSIFCLNPRGDTPLSMRLSDSIYAGCIPILVADGLDFPLVWRFKRDGSVRIENFAAKNTNTTVPLPFDWVVDYSSFAIRVEEIDFIERVDSLIAGMRRIAADARLLECMRRRMLAAAQQFDYVGVFENLGVDNMLRGVNALSRLVKQSPDNTDERPSKRRHRSANQKEIDVLPSQCDFTSIST